MLLARCPIPLLPPALASAFRMRPFPKDRVQSHHQGARKQDWAQAGQPPRHHLRAASVTSPRKIPRGGVVRADLTLGVLGSLRLSRLLGQTHAACDELERLGVGAEHKLNLGGEG